MLEFGGAHENGFDLRVAAEIHPRGSHPPRARWKIANNCTHSVLKMTGGLAFVKTMTDPRQQVSF